jgi:hypothetical protein
VPGSGMISLIAAKMPGDASASMLMNAGYFSTYASVYRIYRSFELSSTQRLRFGRPYGVVQDLHAHTGWLHHRPSRK